MRRGIRVAQPGWMATLRVGDVLANGLGRRRVVRYVRYCADGLLDVVGLAISRRSRSPDRWDRPATLYTAGQLLAAGLAPTGEHVRLTSIWDERLRLYLEWEAESEVPVLLPDQFAVTWREIQDLGLE